MQQRNEEKVEKNLKIDQPWTTFLSNLQNWR